MEAKFGFYFETVHSSPHAAELIDSKNRLSSGLFEKWDRRYQRILRETIEEGIRRGEIDPGRLNLNSSAVVELLLAGGHGIEVSVASASAMHRKLAELVRVVMRGIGTSVGTRPVSV